MQPDPARTQLTEYGLLAGGLRLARALGRAPLQLDYANRWLSDACEFYLDGAPQPPSGSRWRCSAGCSNSNSERGNKDEGESSFISTIYRSNLLFILDDKFWIFYFVKNSSQSLEIQLRINPFSEVEVGTVLSIFLVGSTLYQKVPTKNDLPTKIFSWYQL